MIARTIRPAALLVALVLLGTACGEPTQPTENPVAETAPIENLPTENLPTEAVATFGGGCFWCTEAVFQELEGVLGVESGYSGGDTDDPDYDDVCAGITGHAEAVQVRYDPRRVSYEQILEVFFDTHDPTTLNRQGADVGTQYRSVIFTHDDAQKTVAERIRQDLDRSGAYDAAIVTEVVPFEDWYPAEEYHQDYFLRNAQQGYCQAVIQPKLEKFRKVFADRLKKR